MSDDLERLVEHHRAGMLTEEEFSAAKRRVLGLGATGDDDPADRSPTRAPAAYATEWAPGWYQQDAFGNGLRYWDGQAWTDHVHDQAHDRTRAAVASGHWTGFAADHTPRSSTPAAVFAQPSAAFAQPSSDLGQPSAFGQPHTVFAPPAMSPSLPYRPAGLHVLGRWVQGLLIATGALFGFTALVGVNAWTVFVAWTAGEATVLASLSADESYWSTLGFAVLVMAPTVVVFTVWMFRYWGQVRAAQQGATPKHGRGWTIGGWVIPIGNLWIPKQIIDDYWRLSAGPAATVGWRSRRVSPLVHWWWAAWVAGGVFNQFAGWASPVEEAAWHAFYLTTILGDLTWAVAAVLGAAVVSMLVRRLSELTGYRR